MTWDRPGHRGLQPLHVALQPGLALGVAGVLVPVGAAVAGVGADPAAQRGDLLLGLGRGGLPAARQLLVPPGQLGQHAGGQVPAVPG